MSARNLKMLANSMRVLYISLAHQGRNGDSEYNIGQNCAMSDYFSRAAFAAFKSASRLALTV